MRFELIDDNAKRASQNDNAWNAAHNARRYPFRIQPRTTDGEWMIFDSTGRVLGRLCRQPDVEA